MRKIRYSKDVDALIVELSDKPIDYAEEEGQVIVTFHTRESLYSLRFLMQKNLFLVRFQA